MTPPATPRAEVHVYTLNEEEYVERALRSLTAQEPVADGDVPLIVVDSHSEDATRDIAREYADEVWQVPRGKLTARNRAMRISDADVVASADADNVYPDGWLSTLLAQFTDDDVVAAHGASWPQELRFAPAYLATNLVLRRWLLPANNSAVRRSAFWETGGFDTDAVDETELLQVWREEEWRLHRRLRGVGEVRYVRSLHDRKSTRRYAFSPDRAESYASEQRAGERF